MESKKYSKLLNTRKRPTDKGDKLVITIVVRAGREGQERGKGLIEVQTIMYKINKMQGYIVKYQECSQHFIITMKRVCAS